MTGQGQALPGAPFTCKVVGVSFTPNYPDNLWALYEAVNGTDPRGEELACVLVRKPDNEHDPNAIEVHVPQEGIGMIGHINRGVALRLACELDLGIPWRAELHQVLVSPGHEDRPGIEIRLQRIKREDANG